MAKQDPRATGDELDAADEDVQLEEVDVDAPLDEVDVDAEMAAEAEAGREVDAATRSALDRLLENPVVSLGGREFTIGEPDIGITLRIVNVIGRLGVRGEKIAARLIQNPTSRAVLFGMLAGLSIADLQEFASAVLQFEDEKEGRRFVRDLGRKGLKLAPIIKAFFLNYALSEDLRESLTNFTEGQSLMELTMLQAGI